MRNVTTALAAVVVAGVAAAAVMFGPARHRDAPAPAPAPAARVVAPGAAPAEPGPAAANAPGAAPKALTAKECSVACTKKMHDMGMAGSCPESMCKPGVCPMMTSAAHGAAAAPSPAKP